MINFVNECFRVYINIIAIYIIIILITSNNTPTLLYNTVKKNDDDIDTIFIYVKNDNKICINSI